MPGSLTIRELLTRYSFQTDEKPLKRLDRGVASLKAGVAKLDDKIKSAFMSIAKWATVGAATASVAMIKMASDAQESEDKFRDVFKDQADDVREWSETVAKQLGRSGYKLREFAAGLQDTFVPLGFARDTAATLSKNLTALATDVASFQDKAEPDVINAFTSAMVGNHEAVRSFGVTLTASKLDAKIKELRRTMPGFTSVSKEQQKVLARYQIILESTSDAHGNATSTAGSFANQMRGLRARFERVAISIGSKVLPAVTAWVTKLSEWIDKNEDMIKQNVGKMLESVVQAFQALGKVLKWIIENWRTLSFLVAGLIAGRVLFGIMNLTRGLADMASSLAQVTAGAGGVTGAVGKASGGVAKLSSRLAQAQGLFLALGVGATIGTLLDQWLDISGKLADKVMEVQKAVSKSRVKQHEIGVQMSTLRDTAKRLAELRASGVGSVERTPGGERVALDQAGIRQVLQAQAQRMGALPPELQRGLVDQLMNLPGLRSASAPASPAAAPVQNRSVNVAPATINVTVPPGTGPTQAKRVADAAGAATTAAMRRTVQDVAR